MKFNYVAILCYVLFVAVQASAQSIPVGTPVLEDYYRRSQLLGKLDSTVSFTVRPLYSGLSGTLIGSNYKKKIDFKILPFTLQQQYNTHHPYSINDGAMIPARGYQTMLSGGMYGKFGPLSIQLRPEYVYAENRNFQSFYNEQPYYIKAAYYKIFNFIDLPEKFGNTAYKRIFLGQSNVRVTLGPFSLGLSTENLWWGPGVRNSLVMSNTAPGFAHITLNTIRPVKTWIGTIEGQVIGGRLDGSGYTSFDTIQYFSIYVRKRNDWRYINGFVLSFQPKLIKGLFLGLTRTFIMYKDELGNNIKDYLPIITPFYKKANYGEGESTVPGDQRASAFFRWIWTKEHAEIYCEFFRDDHAFDIRDFIIDPDHTHSYLLGLQKLFVLNGRKNQCIQFNIELSQLNLKTTNPERPSISNYLHGDICQGYTNLGQLLGPGIGPGSAMQSVNLSWIKNKNKIGLKVERYVHNTDFYTGIIQDIRANWVDFTTSAVWEWDYKNLLFSARLDAIRCYNYQWLYRPEAANSSFFWTPGKDVYNYQGNISVTYRF